MSDSLREAISYIIFIVILMICIGCAYNMGRGTKNTAIALYIYSEVKSDDADITNDRKEVFQELQRVIRKSRHTQVPVSAVFDSLLGLNKRQVEFVKKAVRRYIKPPKLATDPKVIMAKDFQDIVERVLNLYGYDSYGNNIDLRLGK